MAKKIKAAPVRVEGGSFADAVEAMRKRAEEEEARVAALSPAERAEWEAEKAAQDAEVEKLLKQLRGPGFMQFNVSLK